MRSIASHLNTSVSNVYSILKDASISVLNSDLSSRNELSASAAFSKRSKRHKPSNALKLPKAQDFINLVCDEILSNPLSSIDETIHSLILHQPERIKGMTTISTKTFYTYVHAGFINIKPIHLPRTVQRKKQLKEKTYIPKRHKGTSIDHRLTHVLDDRLEFGHWEDELVTSTCNGQKFCLLR